MRTMGVEEELLVVHSGSGRPIAVAATVLAHAAVREVGHPAGEIEAELVATGVPMDGDMIYFYARLSRHYPTIEIRIADICARTADTIMIAGLVRALVDTAATAWAAGEPAPELDPEVLRLATWRAGRSGIRGDLLDPVSARARSATQVIEALLDHVAAALHQNEDHARVSVEVERVLSTGTGADQQRAVLERTGDLADVVRAATVVTLA